MELSFLLSDAPVGYGRQLLREITDSSYHAMVFIKDFENLADVQTDFPGVIWIVLDIGRNPDTVIKFLKAIPRPNYIVNLNGQDFLQHSLDVLQRCGVSYKERDRGQSELTLDGIVGDEDEESTIVLVNVNEKRSELKKQSKAFTKKVRKVVKGTKKKLSALIPDEEEDEECQEREPLINRAQNDSTDPGFFASFLSLCCPCFGITTEPEYCFESQQDLRLQIHAEQLAEIRKTFKKLHENSLSRWNNVTMLELRRKESQKIEELVAKIDDLRQNQEQELTNVKDKQNANTRERLSNVLSDDALRRIEESRSRQTKGTSKYDADRAFREGQSLISQQVAIDKAQLRERHYFKLVEEQFKVLTDIQLKYQKKTSALQERYFRTL